MAEGRTKRLELPSCAIELTWPELLAQFSAGGDERGQLLLGKFFSDEQKMHLSSRSSFRKRKNLANVIFAEDFG